MSRRLFKLPSDLALKRHGGGRVQLERTTFSDSRAGLTVRAEIEAERSFRVSSPKSVISVRLEAGAGAAVINGCDDMRSQRVFRTTGAGQGHL